MIDVHCHFDMAINPEKYISDNEENRVITIGMTNLPSHFKIGIDHVKKYKYIRLALGLHPLLAKDHSKEYSMFLKYVDETSYIGEVGLDYSQEGISTKEIQLKSFKYVLDCVKGKSKILSLHSRRAEKDVLDLLLENNIQNAIFHWYSGSISTLNKIVDAGFFFSVNSDMLQSERGKKIIATIPKEYVLTETDHPFIKESNILNIHKWLSNIWCISLREVDLVIESNFKMLVSRIKK